MSEPTSALLEEYRQLFSYQNAIGLALFRIPPLALAIVGAFVAYSGKDGTLPPLAGLGVALAVFVIAAWSAFSHAFFNAIGLKLIEIEQNLNSALRLGEQEKLSFNTSYIAEGRKIIPGFMFMCVNVALALVLILGGGLFHFWHTMSGWGLSSCEKVMILTGAA